MHSNPRRILLVDDEKVNRKLARQLLQGENYDVVEAASAAEAWQQLRLAPVDAIVLDNLMPDVTGIEVLRKLRASDAWRDIPVLMVSALTEREARLQALEARANDFLSRPVDALEFKARLRNLIELKAARDALTEQKGQLESTVLRLENEVAEHQRTSTRLAETARQLQASNDDLSAFTGVISHDLKAPLRGIKNLVDWLLEDLGPGLEAKHAGQLTRVSALTQRMNGMLEGLLEYARAGKYAAEPEQVELRDLFATVVELASPPQGFECRFDIDPQLQRILTVRAPLKEVLLNLVVNAVKHHDLPRGSIVITCRAEAHRVRFSVRDDGPGVAPHLRERIFTLFYSSSKEPGSGRGLAHVKKVVEAVRGSVVVSSPNGGRGLDIQFDWPRDWTW